MTDIINIWMDKINEEMGINVQSNLNKARLLCFGSYVLGVSSPTGDIDCVVLAPNYLD
jgi:poly(A) polymerase Pap1